MVQAYPRKHKNVLTVFWPPPQIGWLQVTTHETSIGLRWIMAGKIITQWKSLFHYVWFL